MATTTKANPKATTTKAAAKAAGRGTPTPATMRAELAKLGKAALQKKFKEVFGRVAKSDNVHHLREAIAKKLVPQQASDQASDSAPGATSGRPAKDRDPRLPASGAVIKRPYKDVTHEVKVLDDAFEYGGERHRSLSAIAKSITGQQTNGFLWFGLVPRGEKPKEHTAPAIASATVSAPAEKRTTKRAAKKQARS